MKGLLAKILITLFAFWNIECKILFFRDLSTQTPYSSNHIYHPLNRIVYKNSIMHVTDTDYVLISTRNEIIKLDIIGLGIVKREKVMKDTTFPKCLKDKYAEEYPCHLFGYWAKIIASNTASGNHQLFICLNNGMATYYDAYNLNIIPNLTSPCPIFSVITLISSDFHFYVGDLRTAPKIFRFSPEYPTDLKYTKKQRLYTATASPWIQQNDYLQFVFIFEYGNFVYILFREIADEDNTYCQAKVVKSRIVRLSKDDDGGSEYRLKENWVSFLKATVICPDNQENIPDSLHNHIINAYFDTERRVLYATFSSGDTVAPSTTICQYSINDLESAFEGLYMNVKDIKNPISIAEVSCTEPVRKECLVNRVTKYQLKFSPILPTSKSNLMFQKNEIWTHIQVITIQRSSRQYNIVFVATSKGEIKKYYQKLTDNTLCYSETLVLSNNVSSESTSIRDMKLINSKSLPQPILIVTVNKGIYKIGVEHCLIHSLESNCIDPFCFWDQTLNRCTSIFQITVLELRQLPELNQCNDGSELQNSKWEPWSSWETCGGNGNMCQCRTRNCKFGVCTSTESINNNYEVQIKNCSMHHEWSSWTDWSGCSSKCGPGNSTRERWCSQNGNCPGVGVEIRSCNENTKCKITESESVWSEWSKCSSKCGPGIITRFKRCKYDSAQVDNKKEKCELVELKSCAGNDCQDMTELSPVGKLASNEGETYYLANCLAKDADYFNSKMTVSIEYESVNHSRFSHTIWSCWTEWTKCNEQCSEQTDEFQRKSRTRICKLKGQDISDQLCVGDLSEDEECNNMCQIGKAVSESKGYQLIHVILVGIATFAISGLIVVAGVCIYFSKKNIITRYAGPTQPSTQSRRPYLRESYSPSQQSPIQSPIDYGWVPMDSFNSIQRSRRNNASLVNIPIPSVI